VTTKEGIIGVNFVKKNTATKTGININVIMDTTNIDVKNAVGVDYVNITDKNILVKNAVELQSVNIKN